jgi:hypothetical protein
MREIQNLIEASQFRKIIDSYYENLKECNPLAPAGVAPSFVGVQGEYIYSPDMPPSDGDYIVNPQERVLARQILDYQYKQRHYKIYEFFRKY